VRINGFDFPVVGRASREAALMWNVVEESDWVSGYPHQYTLTSLLSYFSYLLCMGIEIVKGVPPLQRDSSFHVRGIVRPGPTSLIYRIPISV
jgi:hypothetical protein